MASIKNLQNIANILRRDVLKMTTEAGSGHPTSCLSCAELMACLFFDELALEIKNPDNPGNDEFILSKGHAAPILYSSLYHAGAIKNDLLSLRKFNSSLEGHPLPSLPFIKSATGSLGQGLSIGVGMAIANKLDKKTSRVYVLLGDSELAEGSVYEAFELASYYRLNNLIAIADINRLGQRGETIFGHDVNEYEKRFKGFNWDTIKIDGHNINQILNAFQKARKSNKPTIILAKTLKGKGVSFIEDKNGWHGRALSKEELEKALIEIPNPPLPSIKIKKPLKSYFKKIIYKKYIPNYYEIGKQVTTREAYGNALAQLALSNPRVIAVDAEVSNSTFSEKVKEKTPEQFIEAFIAEQNMIGMALGLSKKNFNVFASTFSAFLTRAHDQLRMAAYSNANITFCGSHIGVSIGEDGVSQMGLEDISLFRLLFNSTIFYPCDAVSTEKLVYECSKLKGIKYIRTTRSKTPVIYSNKETFPIGDFKILKESKNDELVLVGAGITVFEALKAHEELKKKGINTAIIDLYCIKPFDYKKFIDFVKAHGNKIVISEDHYAEGGIGEMISSHLPGTNIQLTHLTVRKLPHSGKPEQLLAFEEIDTEAIVKNAFEMIKNR
ncbi:transketolase [Candidatus Pacearchaeota archaeon]|nr:transketolase [Candidatus Pacearchaeota archaeon]